MWHHGSSKAGMGSGVPVKMVRYMRSLALLQTSSHRGLDLFVCGDQLLRGAALNAVLIAEASKRVVNFFLFFVIALPKVDGCSSCCLLFMREFVLSLFAI